MQWSSSKFLRCLKHMPLYSRHLTSSTYTTDPQNTLPRNPKERLRPGKAQAGAEVEADSTRAVDFTQAAEAALEAVEATGAAVAARGKFRGEGLLEVDIRVGTLEV